MPRLKEGNRGAARVASAAVGAPARNVGQDQGLDTLGQSFRKLGGTLVNRADQIDAIDRTDQGIEGQLSYAEKLSQYREDNLEDTDYETQGDRFEEWHKKTANAIVQNAKNPQAAQDLNNYMRGQAVSQGDAIRRNAAIKRVSVAKARIPVYVEAKAIDAAAAADPDVRAGIRAELETTLQKYVATDLLGKGGDTVALAEFDKFVSEADQKAKEQTDKNNRLSLLEGASQIDDDEEANTWIRNQGLMRGMEDADISWLQSQETKRRQLEAKRNTEAMEDTANNYQGQIATGKIDPDTGLALLIDSLANKEITSSRFKSLTTSLMNPLEVDDWQATYEVNNVLAQLGNGTVPLSKAKNVLAANEHLLTHDSVVKYNADMAKEKNKSQASSYSIVYSTASKQIVQVPEDAITRLQQQVQDAKANGLKSQVDIQKILVSAQKERELQQRLLSQYSDEMKAWERQHPEAEEKDIFQAGKEKLWLKYMPMIRSPLELKKYFGEETKALKNFTEELIPLMYANGQSVLSQNGLEVRVPRKHAEEMLKLQLQLDQIEKAASEKAVSDYVDKTYKGPDIKINPLPEGVTEDDLFKK